MPIDKPGRRIAIVGTGVIGASWAALYLARGFDVVATDPGPKAEANLRKYINEAWRDLTAIGLSPGASRDRLIFASSLAGALAGADLIHQTRPQHPSLNTTLFPATSQAPPPTPLH